jgi:hypothetical protein
MDNLPKPKPGQRIIWSDDDFDAENLPDPFWRPRKRDGWQDLGEGSYRKNIPQSELGYR